VYVCVCVRVCVRVCVCRELVSGRAVYVYICIYVCVLETNTPGSMHAVFRSTCVCECVCVRRLCVRKYGQLQTHTCRYNAATAYSRHTHTCTHTPVGRKQPLHTLDTHTRTHTCGQKATTAVAKGEKSRDAVAPILSP
jgi:hypothetical protein